MQNKYEESFLRFSTDRKVQTDNRLDYAVSEFKWESKKGQEKWIISDREKRLHWKQIWTFWTNTWIDRKMYSHVFYEGNKKIKEDCTGHSVNIPVVLLIISRDISLIMSQRTHDTFNIWQSKSQRFRGMVLSTYKWLIRSDCIAGILRTKYYEDKTYCLY